MIRTFSAPSTDVAFDRIRRTLGEAAVIVDVRRMDAGVEVDASAARKKGLGRSRLTPHLERPLAGVERLPGRSEFAAQLGAMDFPATLTARLRPIAGADEGAWERVLGHVERHHAPPRLSASAPGAPRVLGFLGSRRVGRSTLVRGLSALAALREPGRVVWVEVGFPGRPLAHRPDFDAPLGVDLRCAHRPAELREIASDYSDVSAVLIDFPGIDVFEAGERKALARFVTAARAGWPDLQLHGVLDAAWSARQASKTAGHLENLGAEALAWTGVDLAVDPGTVLATSLRTELPPSFLHGDPLGDGTTSRTANWQELIGDLKTAGATAP